MKRLFRSTFIAVALLAATLPIQATVLWQNLGNAGSVTEADGHGSISHVSSPTYSGSVGAVEATCIYQGSGVRYHSEWGPNGTWNTGTTYFGYSIYLPSSFQLIGTQRAVTEQYGTFANGQVLDPDDYQAWIGGGTANAYQFGGGGISDQTSGTMTTGAWHTVVTKITYGSGGNITVWFDGNQAWSLNTTVNGGGGGNPSGNWALGLYEADWDGGNTGNGTTVSVYNAAATIATTYDEANPRTYAGITTSSNYQIQNVSSGLSVNVAGASTADGAEIIQYSFGGSANELWSFVPTSNGYYQIRSVNSGLDLVVQNASKTDGAGIIQWSFGSSGDDQWKPVLNGDGAYTFYNLNSDLVFEDPDFSTASATQFDQWSANGGSNQEFNVLPQ